ncbi:Uncharacterized protein GBIM_01349 [Gryllus bimaculatus]|nr:Uncharacterized protein GBIM_01349 [Gryllus bimaculatus]
MASRRANYVTGAASAQSLSEATGGASAASVIHATESKSPRRSAIEWYTVTGEYFLSQRGPVPGEGGGKVNQARLRRAGGSPAQPLPGPARRATAHAQPSPSLPPSSRPPPAEAHWHSGADTAQSAGERGLGRRGKHGLRCPAREKSRVSYVWRSERRSRVLFVWWSIVSRGEEMPADAELSSLLDRRQAINEGRPVAPSAVAAPRVSVFTEFHELSRREIREYEATFRRLILA